MGWAVVFYDLLAGTQPEEHQSSANMRKEYCRKDTAIKIEERTLTTNDYEQSSHWWSKEALTSQK